MVFLMHGNCVFCEVWTEYLYRQFLRYVIRNLRKLGLKQKILNYGNFFYYYCIYNIHITIILLMP